MAAITQTTPNFLGGVSRQNDDKKLPNQLTECINGYPDATYGLLKRPGMEHINVLKKADGTAFSGSELEDAAWFFIDRDDAGSYVGAIKGSNIYVWTKEDGTFCTVTNNGSSYLTGTKQSDYHFRSVQDVTVITNKTVTTAMQADATYVANAVATINLNELSENNYTVTIQGIEATVTAQSTTTFDNFLVYDSGNVNTNHHLIDKIKSVIDAQHAASNSDFDGVWSVEAYTNSLVIKRTSGTNAFVTDYTQPTGTPLGFTITAKGGVGNVGIDVFQDNVRDAADLPAESFDGHRVKIVNTNSTDDDYYLEFEAFDGTRGKGYWKESIARDVSPGLDASTMPYQLENTGATTFTFGPINWKDRQVGDDISNAPPSFIGYKLTCSFFYANRFGVLAEDNVFFGVANDSFNFFAKSALVQVDSDPVDLSVSSVRPVVLNDVLPSPQGLLLFSSRQQFQVYAASANTLTPSTAVIRSISSYEMSSNISPVDVGTATAFVNTVPGYGKLFTMQLGEIEQSPLVIDISKVVLEWIPDTIDDLSVSSQNSIIMLTDRDSSYMYLYRFYNNGQQNLFQAWVKWQLVGKIQAAEIIDDDVIIVSKNEYESGSYQYTLGKITLDQIPTGDVTATTSGMTGNPCLDMATRPFLDNGIVGTLGAISAAGTGYSDATNVATTGGTGTGLTVDITTTSGAVSTVTINNRGTGYTADDVITISGGSAQTSVKTLTGVVYDETNDITKIYVPYTPIDDKEAVMFLAVPSADVDTDSAIDSDIGYYTSAIERIETGTGYRYFEVKGKFTDYADGIIVGYGYDFEVTLPKFYYRPQENMADYTATLTISRAKFSVGRTGAIRFKLKADGSNEWKNVEHTTIGDVYSADTNPVKDERQFIVPIHQRNTNFELKVTSDFPYPVSLVSMMWEGNYSPRFYRRA